MRYFTLLAIFYRYCVLQELEYRVNFLINACMSLFWLGWGVISATIFFQYRDRIGDWTYDQVLLVLGLFSFFTGVIEAFFRPNVTAIIEEIRDGTFDFVLVKPINAQFYSSLHSIVLWRLVDIAAGLLVIVFALHRMNVSPTPNQILTFAFMLAMATVIVYSIWLMMVTLAFWFIKVDNLAELFSAFYEAGRFPISVYGTWIRVFLTFVVPIAFITTFPASALIGKLGPVEVVSGMVLAAIFFVFSSRFWNFAIRSYSSASS